MGKLINKFKVLSMAVFVLAGAGIISLSNGNLAFAVSTTKTWVGTACALSTPNCSWSEETNWQEGAAPVDGDNIVINMSATTPDNGVSTINDIPNLVINDITVSGYVTSDTSAMSISSTDPINITINGDITLNTPTVAAPSGYFPAKLLDIGGLDGLNITLGADSIFTNVYSMAVNDEAINLNGHMLTVKITSLAEGLSYWFAYKITGNGTVNYDLLTTSRLQLNDTNDYSGTTNLISLDYVTTLGNSFGMFGTSDINIGPSARILYEGDGNITISNKISITPPTVSGTFLNNQIEFWSDTADVFYTVPNITLLGNARLGTNTVTGTVTVNLAGITTNGHCIQYGDEGDDGIFQNGPAACIVDVAVPITAPNTAIKNLILSNPIVVAIMGIFSATFVVFMFRRQFSKK